MEIPLILNIIDQKAVEKTVEDFKANGKVLAIDSSMFEIEPYYLPSFPGLSLPADFPFCCVFHESVFKGAVEFLRKFPNCCEYHAPLINQKWFKKEKYMNFPDRVLKTLANTEKCIEHNIQNENWHKIILDYIELAIMSMGQFPKGFGSPLGLQLLTDNIKGWMKTQKFIPNEKREIIERFIDDWTNNKSSNEKFNLVELLSIYETWLKLFPFELPFFKALKEHYQKSRPIIKQDLQINSFTGLNKGMLFKTKDFCEYLKNLTNSLLSQINTPELTNEYSLDEVKALNFEMVKQQHTIRQENLFSSILQTGDFGVETITAWLNNEKIFISEFISFLESKAKTDVAMENIKHPVHFIDQYFTEVQQLNVLVVERFFNEHGYMKHIDPKNEPNWPFKKAKFLSIDQYAQRESNYEAEITKLQEKALNEAMLLNAFQLTNIISRAQLLIDKYESFWAKYSELCALNREGRLKMADIELLMYPFFIIDKHEHGQVTQEFIDHLHDAVMFKQGSLLAFKNSLTLTTKATQTITPQNEARKDSTAPEKIENNQDDIIAPEYQTNFNKFVNILKETDPIVLDENGRLLSEKGKNVIVNWLRILGSKGVVNYYSLNDNDKVTFLKSVITGLEISESTVRKNPSNLANELSSFIGKKIDAVKKEINLMRS